MSKLINEIRELQLNTRSSRLPKLNFAKFQETYINNRDTTDFVKYRFEARFGTEVDICEDYSQMSQRAILTEVKKTVQHQVAEEVFGEFRQPLLKLRQLAYASGDKESVDLVEQVLEGMFKI